MTKKILAVHIGDRGKYSAKKLIDQVPNIVLIIGMLITLEYKILKLEKLVNEIPKILNDLIFGYECF